MNAYHGVRDVRHALNVGLRRVDHRPYGCAKGGHICFAERPEVAANFGAVLEVDITGLDVVWELGEGRLHDDVEPGRLRFIEEELVPDWEGWSDPGSRVNHCSCL